VARDRKRAKQRRDRSRAPAASRERTGSKPASAGQPEAPHTPVQGSLEHASGQVDEFDAALVRGAGGPPAPVEEQELPRGDEEQELPDGSEDALQVADDPQASGGGRSGRGGDGAGGGGGGGGGDVQPSGAPLRGGNRVTGFLRASWAELQRVQWPDRRQVSQATAVVIGFVAIAGAYLGLADFVAKAIVEFIL